MTKQKRTLTSEEKGRIGRIFVTICLTLVSALLVVNLAISQIEKQAYRNQIAKLESELGAENQELDIPETSPGSLHLNPEDDFRPLSTATHDESEPLTAHPKLTAIYRYGRLADIPENAPGDQMLLRVKVDDPCRRPTAGTVLAEYTQESIGTKIAFVVPNLGELSEICDTLGYGIVGVFTEKLDSSEARLSVFAFNPVEEPYIDVFTNSYGDVSPRLDVPIWSMSFYSDGTKATNSEYYQSSGVSCSNYRFYGGSNSGNDDYLFNAFSVTPVGEPDDWCRPLEWTKEYTMNYEAYWAQNSQFILDRRSFFSADRNEFDLFSYVKITDVEARSISNNSVTLWRTDGDELMITYRSREEGGYSTITINGERVNYALDYSPRINGLPVVVSLPNGISLTSEQVNIVLKFIENPASSLF